MLLNCKIKNFKTFKNQIEISFIADMRIKKFLANSSDIGGQNILKTTSIYGPNNTGKTCLIEAIYAIKKLMLGEKLQEIYYAFYKNNSINTITEFEITYEFNNRFYRYIVHYDSLNEEYIYEKLDKIYISKYNEFIYEKVFSRNKNSIDIKVAKVEKMPVNLLNNNIPLFRMLLLKKTELEQAQIDYVDFAHSIAMINMELPLFIEKTLELIQKDENAKKFIISFAKNCDLNIDDFGYASDIISDVNINKKLPRFMQNDTSNKEILKIWSKHHDFTVPSVLFDSIGTRKLIALAGYIYESIKNNGVLLIDQLDSSLHHVILRAIIALYNNDLNKKAQLIFTTHDALTMDLRRLFRKDQIYLTDIDENGDNKLIHLSEEFTSRDENGIRGNEDIVDYYLKGRFGGVPTPDLFDSISEVLSDD